jgi:hypothetical protein
MTYLAADSLWTEKTTGKEKRIFTDYYGKVAYEDVGSGVRWVVDKASFLTCNEPKVEYEYAILTTPTNPATSPYMQTWNGQAWITEAKARGWYGDLGTPNPNYSLLRRNKTTREVTIVAW